MGSAPRGAFKPLDKPVGAVILTGMTPPLCRLAPVLAAFALGSPLSFAAEISPRPEMRFYPGKTRLLLPLPAGDTAHAQTTRSWQLQRSSDLKSWVNEGAPVVAVPGAEIGLAGWDVAGGGDTGYYRWIVTDTPAFLGSGGAQVFGYGSVFAARLAENRTVTPENFPARFPNGGGSDGISFDPATASFWTEWNTDPAVWNAALPGGSTDRRLFDFRPDTAELNLLNKNGFVVSERRGSTSFTDLYYQIWTDDLPVYVSSDSLFHAWHRTWITMLEELEELALRSRLITLMNGLSTRVSSYTPTSALSQAKTDALGYIATVRSLNSYVGTGTAPSTSTAAGLAVQATGSSLLSLFGKDRTVDWTQFAPRAHYTNSETLKSYFRSMMWLGRMDFQVESASTRDLGAAVVLTLALKDGGLMGKWSEIDQVLTTFAGRADSLTPPQLLEILEAEGLGSIAAFDTPAKLTNLALRIEAGQAGVQQITSHPILAPFEERRLVLPRSFALFGQKFTPESWALTNFVFDRIWRENPDPNGAPLVRVRRRLPSALDVSFAVFGNDTPADLLRQRMRMAGGVGFRDGHDFSRELVSLRETLDGAGPDAWSGSLYLRVVEAIRSLSSPLAPTVPEAMRTSAWRWKNVHTQLAAWTELRHDNLLYAKQSYTPPVLCFYPAGYVEPRPAFYVAMKRVADFAKEALAPLALSGTVNVRPTNNYPSGQPYDLAQRKTDWMNHLGDMSATLDKLRIMAEAEVATQPFSDEQLTFMRSMVQATGEPYIANSRTYSGWYPKLYLKSVFASSSDPNPADTWDPLVADIHTDSASPVDGDPGAVLYNATGNVGLMLVAVDANGDRRIHGGPVFTYHEFTRPVEEARQTDEAWKATVRARQQPPHPEWTTPFLVPGPITIPSGVY